MTAHAMKGDRERCIDAGMNDYVSKPISQKKLLESILKLGPKEVATPSPEEEPPADQMQVPTSKFDKSTLVEAFGGDMDFLKEVTSMFLDDYPP